MFPRLIVAIVPASLVTLGLFVAMVTFISTASNELTDDNERYMVDFVRLQQEETLETRERKPEKPPEPEQPPPDPVTPKLEGPRMDEAPSNLSGPPLALESGLDISTGFGLSASDGDYLPIVKVQPVYPRRALSRGIEGYVLLEFTVTRTGAVKDPAIIESEPPNVFDDAAVRAALKFKYKPKVVNGEAVDVAGVQNRIIFRLEQ
ncbi:energy transducer TonB [Marinobacter salarius]|uniref:energy transducer TonB n=1 Tax=Marinobacter salarius TaxID=1420917 RepID=UPI003BACC411